MIRKIKESPNQLQAITEHLLIAWLHEADEEEHSVAWCHEIYEESGVLSLLGVIRFTPQFVIGTHPLTILCYSHANAFNTILTSHICNIL